MAESLNVYACRNCEHTQFSKEKPLSCERCGGTLTVVHGVQVSVGEETKKYAHDLYKR